MRSALLAAAGVMAIATGGAALAQGSARSGTAPRSQTQAFVPNPARAPGQPRPPPRRSTMAASRILREALVRTYQTNPTLMAERQSLRQRDEDVAIARAAGRPQCRHQRGGQSGRLHPARHRRERRAISASPARISVPLYSGGRVRNSVRAANTRVEAGRADLRATEGDIFTEAVAAYMDVIRDRSIVQLNQNQVRVLETNLQATRDRFEVGDLTRTDVAQSDARLALARSQLALVEGRLRASEENYRRVIGADAGRSAAAAAAADPAGHRRAGHADRARQQCRSRLDRRAGPRGRLRRRVSPAAPGCRRSARTARPPISTGSAPASAGVNGVGLDVDNTTSSGVGLSLTLPLYQGGARGGAGAPGAGGARPAARDRRSAVERLVVSNTNAAFANYRAALSAIEFERDRGRRQHAGAGRHARRADGRHPQRARRAQRRAGTAEQPGAARHRPARRLCRRLPAAQRHGPGRGGGPQPRRRAALRPDGQL